MNPDILDGRVQEPSTSEAGNPTAAPGDSRKGTTEPMAPDAPDTPDEPDAAERSRLAQLWDRINPTLVLENQGSVARDHLASERTFLAYLRTSLVVASTGVALVQLFSIATTSTDSPGTTEFTLQNDRIARYAKPLGAITTAFGLVVLALGVFRYFSIQKALLIGMFPVTRYGLLFMTFFLSSMIIVVFAVLVAENR